VITVITSIDEVLNSYSPGEITPMVDVPAALLTAIDFTAPLKYSLTLSICKTSSDIGSAAGPADEIMSDYVVYISSRFCMRFTIEEDSFSG
jgi:hypothetical protein